tara:strand:+ start:1985 stop:3139 length:1155 start_codon:yes stop_codon:yes gene_type:complete
MLYSDNKGKYQKAYDYLYKKLVPPSGRALNNLGEALRLVSRVYYRRTNDGDSYGDCIDQGMVQDFSEKKYPFVNEYHELGQKLDSLFSSEAGYDYAVDLVLVHIMISLSSESNIYNPETNRLVPIDSAAGKKALAALNLNSVFINYCGKNEDWLPESLRKEGVKISKTLSEGTRKELKCDTSREIYTEKKQGYSTKKTRKVITLSKDNTILSKKFSKIKSEHKKSVKAAEKQKREQQKLREKRNKERKKLKVKDFKVTKLFYEQLRDLSVSKRSDVLQKMGKNAQKSSMVKMLLKLLIEYKNKKVTTKEQRKNKKEVIEKLTKGLNDIGKENIDAFGNYDPEESYYEPSVELSQSLYKKLDNMLIEILESSDAVDSLYQRSKYD